MVNAPSASDLESSKSCVRSISETVPRPSQRGHMPPRRVKLARTVFAAPRSTVIAPRARTDGVLNENALAGPMHGFPSRLKRMRSNALASVAVPTVERGSAPMRCWSTVIAVVNPSRTSTSGRASVGMKPCTKVLYVSLISRCDSAAIVPNTSELLPEPETPVNTVSRRFGISTLTSLRLFTRAPCTPITSWLRATCSAGDGVSFLVAVVTVSPVLASASGVLNEPEHVAIGVGERGHEAAATDVVRGLLQRATGGGHLGQLGLDVRDMPVGHR